MSPIRSEILHWISTILFSTNRTKDLYEFTPIASARIYNQTESEWPVLLLKGGVSFPFTPEAALYFQPELKKSNFLSIDAEYTGFWGDLPVAELDRGGTEIVKGGKGACRLFQVRSRSRLCKILEKRYFKDSNRIRRRQRQAITIPILTHTTCLKHLPKSIL